MQCARAPGSVHDCRRESRARMWRTLDGHHSDRGGGEMHIYTVAAEGMILNNAGSEQERLDMGSNASALSRNFPPKVLGTLQGLSQR
jgi:hypothetical protein